jgi:hypothetical protein
MWSLAGLAGYTDATVIHPLKNLLKQRGGAVVSGACGLHRATAIYLFRVTGRRQGWRSLAGVGVQGGNAPGCHHERGLVQSADFLRVVPHDHTSRVTRQATPISSPVPPTRPSPPQLLAVNTPPHTRNETPTTQLLAVSTPTPRRDDTPTTQLLAVSTPTPHTK